MTVRTEVCVCGGILIADAADPTEIVALHNRSLLHVTWRLSQLHDPRRYRPTAEACCDDVSRAAPGASTDGVGGHAA